LISHQLAAFDHFDPRLCEILNAIVHEREPHIGLPAHWQAVIDAVEDACSSARSGSATTGLVARRLSGLHGSPRTLLRVLRRRGYVQTLTETADGDPIRWTLTPAGRALTTRRPRT
jgi:hypothetical protein